MGARLINNPRRTNIGHVEDFPVLHMRLLRKSAMFNEGQRTEGHFIYPGASNAITIIVDLRSEHDLYPKKINQGKLYDNRDRSCVNNEIKLGYQVNGQF